MTLIKLKVFVPVARLGSVQAAAVDRAGIASAVELLVEADGAHGRSRNHPLVVSPARAPWQLGGVWSGQGNTENLRTEERRPHGPVSSSR